jgi:hypothetical protein
VPEVLLTIEGDKYGHFANELHCYKCRFVEILCSCFVLTSQAANMDIMPMKLIAINVSSLGLQ